MESRYFFLRLSGSIGSQRPKSEDAPHLLIADRERIRLSDYERTSRILSIRALCLSSLAGNSDIDIRKTGDGVYGILDSIGGALAPYSANKAAPKVQPGKYDKYFDMLDEMKRRREEKATRKASGNADGNHGAAGGESGTHTV